MSLPPASPTVSVIIPVRNEAKNLPWLFGRMPHGLAQIVIVDGRSSDGTVEVARALCPHATIITQSRRGKGNALVCGFAAATGEIIVMLDADGSAHPSEIVRFVSTLMEGAEFAKGSRFLPGGGSSDITKLRRIGNQLLSELVNRLFKTDYTDLCYGYNAFRRECVPHFSLPAADGHMDQLGDGFEIETMINLRAAGSPLAITEVPSYESERLHGASNLNAVTDGLRILGLVLREWFRSVGKAPLEHSSRSEIAEGPARRATDTGVKPPSVSAGSPSVDKDTASPPRRPRAPLDLALSTSNAGAATAGTKDLC